MMYSSSRGAAEAVPAAQAIKMGIAPDGGLFVPDHIPQIDSDTLTSFGKMFYAERAERILSLYLQDFSPGDRPVRKGGLQFREFR